MIGGVLPAQIPGAVRARILRLTERLSTDLQVNQIFLYGSFAVGTYGADSDIDIAVFLAEGSSCGLETYLKLNRLIGDSEYDIQLQVFPEDELCDPCGIVEEIAAHGILLWKRQDR